MKMKKYTGKTSTAIIPYESNKILLIKRNTVPFKGYWALPGGRVDPGDRQGQGGEEERGRRRVLELQMAVRGGVERPALDHPAPGLVADAEVRHVAPDPAAVNVGENGQGGRERGAPEDDFPQPVGWHFARAS